MKLVLNFEDRLAKGLDGIIQCLAWPSKISKSLNVSTDLINDDTKLVVIGTSSGSIKLIDLKKNKVVWKENIGSLIFDLDWNEKGVLAIASPQQFLILKNFQNS